MVMEIHCIETVELYTGGVKKNSILHCFKEQFKNIESYGNLSMCVRGVWCACDVLTNFSILISYI